MIDIYNIGTTPEELRQAIIDIRGDFDSHNHDGTSSKSFETLRAESIIARVLISGVVSGAHSSLRAGFLAFYSSSNILQVTLSTSGLIFYDSVGALISTMSSLATGILLQGGRLDLNMNTFFYSKLEPLTSEDNIDIGTTVAGHRFRTIYLINSPDVSSSREGKEKIKNLQYGLAEVIQMQPVSFVRKTTNPDRSKPKNPDEPKVEEKNLGFIAEDLNLIVPEVASPTSYRPDHMIPILVRAIQELNDRIVSLENP